MQLSTYSLVWLRLLSLPYAPIQVRLYKDKQLRNWCPQCLGMLLSFLKVLIILSFKITQNFRSRLVFRLSKFVLCEYFGLQSVQHNPLKFRVYTIFGTLLYYSCPGSSVNRHIKPTCINPRPLDTGSTLLVTNIVPVFPGCQCFHTINGLSRGKHLKTYKDQSMVLLTVTGISILDLLQENWCISTP